MTIFVIDRKTTGILKMLLSSFAVGVTNPAAILTFLFAFSYFGISANAGLLRGIMLVCGVFIGTYIWWGTLAAVTNIIRWFKMKSKLLQLFFCVTVMAILLSGCAGGQRENSSKAPALSGSETTQAVHDGSISDMSFDTEDTRGDNDITEENMILQIGDSSFTATLERNEAVDALVDMMRKAPVVIQMSDYSGFEKVGPLGTSLPTSDKQTTTQSGDIVLYNGNQIVIFYGSNSWSYTKLGKIDDLSGWEDALGNGDVTVTFSLELSNMEVSTTAPLH